MISSRPVISREGVMKHRSVGLIRLYGARRTPVPAKRAGQAALSTDWPGGSTNVEFRLLRGQ
jgi:hypothetical protein